MRRLLSVLVVAAMVSGCADRPFLDARKGAGVDSQRVQKYAVEHNVTYEQALETLRKESDAFWAKHEAEQKTGEVTRDKTPEPIRAKPKPTGADNLGL